ncbi:MAG: hypothetical protein KC418_20165 [Anaerolineales bacterium]|nr:hypothetical protein [Anaerolineales bacterium]MCB8950821.1 hypothetical protein [Ardenticatenales bacterium]
MPAWERLLIPARRDDFAGCGNAVIDLSVVDGALPNHYQHCQIVNTGGDGTRRGAPP